jgi:hypothetical protein
MFRVLKLLFPTNLIQSRNQATNPSMLLPPGFGEKDGGQLKIKGGKD